MDTTAVGQWVLRAFYALNFAGAGSQGVQLLLGPSSPSVVSDWGEAVRPPLAAAVAGSVFTAISLTSLAGLVNPAAFSPILLFQFVYKTIFFFRSTLPALRRNKPADRPAIKMGLIFAAYTFVLPWFLPWGRFADALRG